VQVVGALTSSTFGYRPFTSACLRIVDEADGGAAGQPHRPPGRRLELSAEVHVDGSAHRVVATTLLPDVGRGRWSRAAAVTWQLVLDGAAEPVATGRCVLGWRDACRMVMSFEPSGATNVGGRLRAAVAASRLVSRRPP
jgi:hypothetical protein